MGQLQPVSILLTAVGAPGASTCIRHLRGIRERTVRVVGVDASAECIGRFLADAFEVIPPANKPGYVEALLRVAREHDVDCLVVSSTAEVEFVAPHVARFEALGVKVLVSSPESLAVGNNKRRLYELFRHHPVVKVPDFRVVGTLEEFERGCREMGYPDRDLCFKPPQSKGSRGFRYLSEHVDRADLLLNHKPDSKIITLQEMREIFSGGRPFPELLLMETVRGEEIDSMVLCLDGEALLITHKTREAERGGVITLGEHVERPVIDAAIRAILAEVPLSYNIGIQFKGGYLMEINPRLSSFLYTEDWVEPYFAIKLALGEYTRDDVRALQARVPQPLRMIRYFDQHFFSATAAPDALGRGLDGP